MIRGNNELALHVPDPQAAATFYVEVLGCELVRSDQDCVELVNGALRLFLLRDPAPKHEAVVPSFDVSDRTAALARLEASGCTLVPIGPHAPEGVYVRDPFGVLFDVVERQSPHSGTDPPTCGMGLAEHSEIPAMLGRLLGSLADNLEAHVPTINVASPAGRAERDAYVSLVSGFRGLAARMSTISSEMAGYRDLPMAPHHEAALGHPRIATAFRGHVALEGEVATLLSRRHAEDERMLDGMRREADRLE